MKIVYSFAFIFLLGTSAFSQSYFGDSQNQIRVSASSEIQDAANTLSNKGLDADEMEIARFLNQAGFGYTRDYVQNFKTAYSFESWIDEQLDIPETLLTEQMWHNWDRILERHEDKFNKHLANILIYRQMSASQIDQDSIAPPLSVDEVEEERERYLENIFGPYALHFNNVWWEEMLTSEAQLRQRMAYALSQIFVISSNSLLGDEAEALTSFYDILLRHAFGNFRDLLEEVTYSPAMAFYLSHLNNPKAIPEQNIHPDENYAREVMQLFTIGLYELNKDGTRKQDSAGNDIPTYNNNDIKEMARVFTGLGPGELDRRMYEAGQIDWTDEAYFGLDLYAMSKEDPLIMYQEWHDIGAKSLLNGLEIPANQAGNTDIGMALDYLFNHPNTGPFICRQLIQRFVTSNPSPSYIDRVASIFNNDGTGTRGNLGAVIKAILLDPEARECHYIQEPGYGKLSEPLLRHIFLSKMATLVPFFYYEDISFTSYDSAGIVVTLVEEFGDDISDIIDYWHNGYESFENLRQYTLMSPTVFNFYLPDHQPVGDIQAAGLVAPEYKIHDSSSSVNYLNTIFNGVGNPWWNNLWWNYHDRFTQINPKYNRYTEIFENKGIEAFIHHLDIEFTYGNMSDELREILRQFNRDVPNWVENEQIAKYLIYLTMISPDYTVNK